MSELTYQQKLEKGMPVTDNEVLEQVLAPQEPEQQIEEVQEAPQEQVVPKIQEETPQAMNFRLLREKAERLERENREMKKMWDAKVTPEEAPEDLDFSMAPDELAEGKHLSKVQQKIKRLENQLKQQQQQTYEQLAEARVKAQFPDFEQVVSVDNIKMFSELYPEVAESINSHQDLYKKAVAAYTMIKKFGIVPDETYKADAERAQKNASKPKPLASVNPQYGDSPLSKANAFANGLTPELAKQLRKEMEEARRNN